jgi:hypothetical protein
MGEFLQKHHERLTDAGFCTEEHLAELGRNLERLREAQSASDKANEEYIQATANLAEHEQGLIEKIFESHFEPVALLLPLLNSLIQGEAYTPPSARVAVM